MVLGPASNPLGGGSSGASSREACETASTCPSLSKPRLCTRSERPLGKLRPHASLPVSSVVCCRRPPFGRQAGAACRTNVRRESLPEKACRSCDCSGPAGMFSHRDGLNPPCPRHRYLLVSQERSWRLAALRCEKACRSSCLIYNSGNLPRRGHSGRQFQNPDRAKMDL